MVDEPKPEPLPPTAREIAALEARIAQLERDKKANAEIIEVLRAELRVIKDPPPEHAVPAGEEDLYRDLFGGD